MNQDNATRRTPAVSIGYMCALIAVVGSVWINLYERTMSGDVATLFTARVIGFAVFIALASYGLCWITKRRDRWSFAVVTLIIVVLSGWGVGLSDKGRMTTTVQAGSDPVAETVIQEPSTPSMGQFYVFQLEHPELRSGDNMEVFVTQVTKDAVLRAKEGLPRMNDKDQLQNALRESMVLPVWTNP